ncbi:FAD-linked oxidase C-terminal domain-containing protein [Winogradskyella maritima]|uniref:FAD-binding and (Fe-S)-binding domain-containing protein n=1 Tax=Winogradskyella maritima TaxID=1517766 RepID=A0ABV8AKT3_9FLAO|nr:FAD-linked oxidase C-terminal domain-containing protein [Winogradskyella maritima]
MLTQKPKLDDLDLNQLKQALTGDLFFDDLHRRIYATDASVYKIIPKAVAYPKTSEDIKSIIAFATKHQLSIIPRTAGTSLAGQCVGDGIVVDVSKYFTKIIAVDREAKTVTLQPGVVRDELNNYLEPYGLFFGPNTSTSNRCMIGGMVGNNSSGTTSIKYGVTRDKVLQLKTILSDGSETTFKSINSSEFEEKCNLNTLEGAIYKTVQTELTPEAVQDNIKKEFPDASVHRRNNGYAIDELIKLKPFEQSGADFNLCQLLSGSEGTLAFTTEITLQLDDMPPEHSAMLALHFKSISDCMHAVEGLMQHDLYMCEMMDDTILNLTKHNKTQQANRFFVEGNPTAILLCELRDHNEEGLEEQIETFTKTIKEQDLAYHFPTLRSSDIDKAFELRKAGLGLLGNMIGDKKAVACIEDTAVPLDKLAQFIDEFAELMKGYNQNPVYYAHAGAGEIHLRPILNLKDGQDVSGFRQITSDVAYLAKKYNGAMSGEHGDGIVRSEFIPTMIGQENFEILKRIKTTFDPNNIMNPGKIIDALPMDKNLRYQPNREEPQIETLLDFSKSEGILREAEKCNGSGDCRKLPEFGGTMCPSYRATKDEKDTTRARANALRDYLTNSDKANKFNHEELKEVFDLCLSCKACASECPSSVDVASLKAEFQYQYQEANGYGFKDRFFANATKYNRLASKFSGLSNFMFSNKVTSGMIKSFFGIHPKRSLPRISKSFKIKQSSTQASERTIYLFVDEFTNYLESEIAQDAYELLTALGYSVNPITHLESGRAQLSKGFLQEAKAIAETNVSELSVLLSENDVLVGIEPSAILSFKDEYPRLVEDKDSANALSEIMMLVEDFLAQEIENGNITADQFTDESKKVKFHGHCHQKALGNQKSSFDVLNLPSNYKVTIIPSGCCGMAGSFGYTKDKYEVSMAIGNQTLFPAIKKADASVIISANGTSCRHQIKDGTDRVALHPVSILRQALK